MKNFKNNAISYDYGTIFIPSQNQKMNNEDLFNFLKKTSKETYINITGVKTGLNEGIDLGSNNFKSITKPKVAMLVGNGIFGNDAGEIWHLFDQRFNIPITKLDLSYFDRIDISKYTTIIIPNSFSVSTEATQKLKKWVLNGGILIGYRNTINWLVNEKFIRVNFKRVQTDTIKNITFEDKQKSRGAQVIGGAIFKAKLDRSHPINFGYKNNSIALFRNTRLFIEPSIKSYNNPIQYTSDPLLSGYISKENLKEIKNSIPFKIQNLSKGKVLIFTDNTNFRGFWYGTNKLLMNAVFFSKIM